MSRPPEPSGLQLLLFAELVCTKRLPTLQSWLEGLDHVAKVLLWRRKPSRRCSQISAEEHKHGPRSQLGWNDTELVPPAPSYRSHTQFTLGTLSTLCAGMNVSPHLQFTLVSCVGLSAQQTCKCSRFWENGFVFLQRCETANVRIKQMMNLDNWSQATSVRTPCPRLSSYIPSSTPASGV